MDKEKLKEIIRPIVESVWYGVRNINPVEYQIESIADKLSSQLEPPFGVPSETLPCEQEMILRRLLWLRHGCNELYGDDGEMQCSKCMIDFKRDDARDIDAKFELQALRILKNLASKS